MHLEWWNPTVGCGSRKNQVKEVWIRVIGLPLLLWTREILKKLGNRNGGFLAMDKGTTLKMDLLWARILVKMEGKEKPSSVNILVGARSNEFFFFISKKQILYR